MILMTACAGAVAGIDIADHIELALSSHASHAAIGIASGSSPFRPYIIDALRGKPRDYRGRRCRSESADFPSRKRTPVR